MEKQDVRVVQKGGDQNKRLANKFRVIERRFAVFPGTLHDEVANMDAEFNERLSCVNEYCKAL